MGDASLGVVRSSDQIGVQPMDIRVLAMAALGEGLSGSDRIFIELARRWATSGHRVHVYVWEEGLDMCLRNGLPDTIVTVWPAERVASKGRLASYLGRSIIGVRSVRDALSMDRETVVYSASDFWPDVLPAWRAKRRFGATWIAGFYMFAPPPNRGFEGAAGRRFPRPEDVLYWVSQRLALPLIRRWADLILVTNDLDAERLRRMGTSRDRVLVVRGGVDVKLARATPADDGVRYDAVFIGRLHVQKGVRQLLEIWRRVVDQLPDAKLAVIGVGPLEAELRATAHRLRLDGNVDFKGFMDGAPKFALFRRTKVVLHPALYDSGGMAACEAFACGLPGVAFDLPELRTYYPRGMLKVRPYDLGAFADAVVTLLRDAKARSSLGLEALDLAQEWDWDARAIQIGEDIARVLALSRRR